MTFEQLPNVAAEARDVIDVQIKIISATFDKAAAYTNLLILGGYGAFFALWPAVVPHIATKWSMISALLMLTSAVVFVAFNVYQMIWTNARMLNAYASVLNRKLNGEALVQALQVVELQSQRDMLSLLRVWWVATSICIVTAAAAVGILLVAFVALILRLW